MAKAPKSAAGKKAPHSKASRPEVTPLGEHLAALLNPALNERQLGVSEAQANYNSALYQPPGTGGVAATAESLKDLLERGDPNIREKSPWTPHRPPRPDKSEGGQRFRVVSEFEPKGDQPAAIDELVEGITSQERDQVLLGVTGSGKTFTMAQVIARTNRPALVLAPEQNLGGAALWRIQKLLSR